MHALVCKKEPLQVSESPSTVVIGGAVIGVIIGVAIMRARKIFQRLYCMSRRNKRNHHGLMKKAVEEPKREKSRNITLKNTSFNRIY
jgi:orotate phosphoribosyltransferase